MSFNIPCICEPDEHFECSTCSCVFVLRAGFSAVELPLLNPRSTARKAAMLNRATPPERLTPQKQVSFTFWLECEILLSDLFWKPVLSGDLEVVKFSGKV
jgi:hypothetical protein